MAFDENLKVWMDGEFVALKDAKISVLSHVVHYGPAVFRLKEHVQRLFDSAKIYKMEIPFTQEEICDAIIETIKENNLKGCYIRPITYRGFGELGVNPLNCPVNTTIAVWEWGAYIGEEEMEQGANIGISTFPHGENQHQVHCLFLQKLQLTT